jgi:SpoVK/Ycf46/Vps4 family AAA+-type ATPase
MRRGEGESGYKVIIDEADMELLKKLVGKKEMEDGEMFGWRYQHSIGRGKAKVDVSEWDGDTVSKLQELLAKKAAAGDRSAAMSSKVLAQWVEIRRNPDGATVNRFENLVAALKAYVGKSERKWIFSQTEDGNLVPWFVSSIEYHPPGAYSLQNVSLSLRALNITNGEKGCIDSCIRPNDFDKNMKMSELLAKKGMYLETPERIKSLQGEVEKFKKICEEDGLQLNVRGKAELVEGWSRRGFRTVGQAGRDAKMVVDPQQSEKDISSIAYCEFWDKNEEKLWELPIHPILDLFDLDEHAHYRAHINNVERYQYDTTVGNKLVLPQEVKEFIETIIEHSRDKFRDIVSGKEGGTIVLLEGPPGTGKTLTAEVYSEVMQRPLYRVQSSQLGLDVDAIEKELQKVLERAERWGAILLIDESDVYVHERGDNIIQNAIVGVFLRVLEYYRGVLFFTTNRGCVVDDAIVSRLTARLRYQSPSPSEQKTLWSILSDQNGVKIPAGEIDRILTVLPKLSGRDIKNLLKLALVVASKSKKPVDAEMLKKLSFFKQTEKEIQ